MRLPAPSRIVQSARTAACIAAFAAPLPVFAQSPAAVSTMPPTSPTSAAQPIGTAAPAASTVAASHPEITYAGGLLRVSATNASLNQILREIARLTGMKITGRVQDDKVFGIYGPAPASEVLTSLLDGASVNLIIVDNSANGPAELILTPRRGGATPPNPNAVSEPEPDPDATPQRNIPPSPYAYPGPPRTFPPSQGLPPSNGGQTGTPIDGGANLGTTPGAFTPAGQTPPDITAQPTDPNASSTPAVTPQQIFEQLQRLRQQQQQQQSNPQ